MSDAPAVPVAHGAADPFGALGGVPERVNIAGFLPEGAAAHPGASAVVSPARGGKGWHVLTYGDLESRSNRIAAGSAPGRTKRHTRMLSLIHI